MQTQTTDTTIVTLYKWTVGHYEAWLDGTDQRWQVYRTSDGTWDVFSDLDPCVEICPPTRTRRDAMYNLMTHIQHMLGAYAEDWNTFAAQMGNQEIFTSAA
jgi:hypothetical protein